MIKSQFQILKARLSSIVFANINLKMRNGFAAILQLKSVDSEFLKMLNTNPLVHIYSSSSKTTLL